MGTPRLPNLKIDFQKLNRRLGKYCVEVQGLYDTLASSAARKVLDATSYDGTSPFLFKAFPQLSKTARDLQTDFANSMLGLVTSYTSKEWQTSNIFQDLIAKKALKYYDADLHGEKKKVYYQTNSDALKAFQTRASNGMNLSTNIWQQSDGAMRELEGALSVSIEKGVDAITVSKRVSKYLRDFPSLQKDYTAQFGKADNLHDCEYRSIRLARSEINMAYRAAEQERWQQFDFIKGYEVKTSGSHPQADICDDLAGEYPKDFVFLGWHPNCMCYVVPIVMSEDEYWDYQDAKDEDPDAEPEGYITETPSAFNEYVGDNADKIEAATARGTAPYWVRDNQDFINRAMKGETRAIYPVSTAKSVSATADAGTEASKPSALEIAAQRHANRTAQDIQDITDRAAERERYLALVPDELKTGREWFGAENNTRLDPEFFALVNPAQKIKLTVVNGSNDSGYFLYRKEVRLGRGTRVAESSWYRKAVVYHEYGHSIDHNYYSGTDIGATSALKEMRKRQEAWLKEKITLRTGKTASRGYNLYTRLFYINNKISSMDEATFTRLGISRADVQEQITATADTLKSLTGWGWGHTDEYFAGAGKKETEYIAHAFENAFAGNRIFEKLMPDIYREMTDFIKALKPFI